MSKPERKLDQRLFFAASAVFALLLLFAGYRTLRRSAGLVFGDFFYPYLSLARVASHGVSDQSLLLFSRSELAAKLEALTTANRMLAAKSRQTDTLAGENRELRRLLKLPPLRSWNYLPVEVILRDPLLWKERFTINAGETSGIKAGAAVIAATADGIPTLVGVVARVGRRNAEVETLFSPSLRISADFRESGGTGILNAGERRPHSGSLPVGFLPAHLKYRVGEEAFTTGFESGIPGGIKIGRLATVEEVDSNFSSTLHLSGLLAPESDFDHLRFPVVVVPAAESPEARP